VSYFASRIPSNRNNSSTNVLKGIYDLAIYVHAKYTKINTERTECE